MSVNSVSDYSTSTVGQRAAESESWYTLPDSVREKVESAQEMLGLTVTGANSGGDTVTGIVANAELSGSSVYLVLFDGTRIDIDTVSGEAKTPTAEDALRDLVGLKATGLDEDGNQVSGIIAGAEDREGGLALILDDGNHLYYDSLLELSLPDEE